MWLMDLENLGSSSLNLMNLSAFGGSDKGNELAKKAEQVAKRRNTVGSCFSGAGEAINGVFGSGVWGGSAYMAAD